MDTISSVSTPIYVSVESTSASWQHTSPSSSATTTKDASVTTASIAISKGFTWTANAGTSILDASVYSGYLSVTGTASASNLESPSWGSTGWGSTGLFSGSPTKGANTTAWSHGKVGMSIAPTSKPWHQTRMDNSLPAAHARTTRLASLESKTRLINSASADPQRKSSANIRAAGFGSRLLACYLAFLYSLIL